MEALGLGSRSESAAAGVCGLWAAWSFFHMTWS